QSSEIAYHYGASRNTVREAMRQLRAEKLIIYIRYRGNIVRMLTPADVHDIYRVRRVLELSAIEQSAFASDDTFSVMHNTIESAEQALKAQQWREVGTWSLRFHQSVVALLASALLDDFFRIIVAQLRLVFALADDEKRFQTPRIARDQAIHVALIRDQLHTATNAMKRYLEESEAGVLDLVRAAKSKYK